MIPPGRGVSPIVQFPRLSTRHWRAEPDSEEFIPSSSEAFMGGESGLQSACFACPDFHFRQSKGLSRELYHSVQNGTDLQNESYRSAEISVEKVHFSTQKGVLKDEKEELLPLNPFFTRGIQESIFPFPPPSGNSAGVARFRILQPLLTSRDENRVWNSSKKTVSFCGT
ncbi:hypothetical protein TNIN_118651 [Trichonephila inaurata madagascariensis]|uniref:Uncharacterized protein n=1 Tax=Trichonephila inaurata madagascariensis TaxID=2747483 RepID=A0A8X6XKG8_9ARAC|nr:hypothetical protein TNIN_118651 [Trichonephila inaurata madagascariensis]